MTPDTGSEDDATEDDADDVVSRAESRLVSHGVYVDEVTVEADTYRLTYESVAADDAHAIPHREVGRVINVFRDLHPDDWEGADIEATVSDLEGTTLGEWHVQQEWLGQLNEGDLSEVEFSERVIETIETA
jgi:hypothetical protein